MRHDTSRTVRDHLEFLGYKIEMKEREGDDDYDTYIAKSEVKPNLYVRSNRELIYVRSPRDGFKVSALRSKDFYVALNSINSGRVVTKCYYDDTTRGELSIIVSAVVFGYDKVLFGELLEAFNADVQSDLQVLKSYAV